MLDGKCDIDEFVKMLEEKYADILAKEKENNNSTK